MPFLWTFLKRRVAWVFGGLVVLAILARSVAAPSGPAAASVPSPGAVPVLRAESEPFRQQTKTAGSVELSPERGAEAGAGTSATVKSRQESHDDYLMRREAHRKQREPEKEAAERKAEEAKKLREEQNSLLRRAQGLPTEKQPTQAHQPVPADSPVLKK